MFNSILAAALILSALVTIGVSSDYAFAASFAKYDGIDGESKDSVNDTENEGTFVLQPPKEASASADVPPWIKTSMTYWVEGHTSDAEFLSAVEFLANEKIIQIDAEIPFMAGPIPMSDESESQESTAASGGFDTEMVSMNAARTDSFFDVFYESYTVDSFFDVWTELQESSDSFFDVFFEVDTPRADECQRGEELVFDTRSSSWRCAPADNVDSFFDVFYDVAGESSQNTQDIAALEKKIAELERKIAELEGSTSGNVETEFKVEKGQ